MTTEASRKGKASREKGARGERLLVQFLSSLGITAKRGYVFLKQSDLTGIPGIHVECKAVEALNVRKALDQAVAEADKRKDGLPTVFWKKNRKGWVTIMRTEDWAVLYKMALYGGKRDTERADSDVYEDE